MGTFTYYFLHCLIFAIKGEKLAVNAIKRLKKNILPKASDKLLWLDNDKFGKIIGTSLRSVTAKRNCSPNARTTNSVGIDLPWWNEDEYNCLCVSFEF